MVRVAHECHLLRVDRLLLRHFTRLQCDSLLLDVHRGAGGVLVAAHGLYGASSFGTLLLCKAHIFWLHHVGRHAQGFLMTAVSRTCCTDGLNLGLLHGHHVERLLRRYGIKNIVIGCLLSTEISIIIVQCIQNFAKCFVEARI